MLTHLRLSLQIVRPLTLIPQRTFVKSLEDRKEDKERQAF